MFPYSHLLYAELVTAETLAVRFATHRILLVGENLEGLLEHLGAQRLAAVRALPKRLRASSAPGAWVERIEVQEVGKLNQGAENSIG